MVRLPCLTRSARERDRKQHRKGNKVRNTRHTILNFIKMLKLVVYRSRIFYRYMILLDHDRCNPTFICRYIYVHILPLKSSYFLLIVKSTPLFRSHTQFLLIDFQIFSEMSFVFHTVHRSIVLLMVMFCCAFRYELDLEHEPW